jgi:hypothetical protein
MSPLQNCLVAAYPPLFFATKKTGNTKNMHAWKVKISQFFGQNHNQTSICQAEIFGGDSLAHGASFHQHPDIKIHQQVHKLFATKVAICHDFRL